MIRCQSQHCCCCRAGATMTVERRAGLREPMCADCYMKLRATLGLREPRKIVFPCACLPAGEKPKRLGPKPLTPRQLRHMEAVRARREHRTYVREVRIENNARAAALVRVTARRFGVTQDELATPTNLVRIVGPRGVASYLLHTECGFSFAAIGRFFGGMHHTSIMHHVHRITRFRAQHPAMATLLRQLLQAANDEPVDAEELVFTRGEMLSRYMPGWSQGDDFKQARRYLMVSIRHQRVWQPRSQRWKQVLREVEEKKMAMPALAMLKDEMEQRRHA